MAYTPLLKPRRGFMIEKFQPITNLDVQLVRQILDENDEIVIGIGDAGTSHEKGRVMTAGERVTLVDRVLQSEGIEPGRYMIVPVENVPDHTQWVAQVMMLTPRWDTFYTRNFKNASMFSSFTDMYGYQIKTIAEQKQEKDYFETLAQSLGGDAMAPAELRVHIPSSAIEIMHSLGIDERVNIIYRRVDKVNGMHRNHDKRRALFLGGFQPFTGVYADGTGHIGCVMKALGLDYDVVIAVGSAQESHKETDPLTVGRRIDVIRYSLLANGVPAERLSIIPIADIASNACFAPKVVTMCPAFEAVLAGNDWTKELFGESSYGVIPVERTLIQNTNRPLSATLVRNIIMKTIKHYHSKGDQVSPSTIAKCEGALRRMMDPHALAMLSEVGFYDRMKFLAYAKE